MLRQLLGDAVVLDNIADHGDLLSHWLANGKVLDNVALYVIAEFR
jgi:hypothetical protein